MSSNAAIRVAGLGKQYHLGASRARYSTLRDQLRDITSSSLRALWRRGRQAEAKPSFWALKDVSFEVTPGDVVGIIGRNGAGKSTLLKILSRITEPTEGEAVIRGRVGSLLEVGTGFHPELTGRENVFLNGAILGMSRAEIKRRFDEIVAFAEVEKFIDTPVKHYSSGMYMRLAFAVAAHLEPEILIVDEVLAVGDAEFQAKCLGKMGQVSKSGRTVLFVSHNITAIASLCSRVVILQGGRIEFSGNSADGISRYTQANLLADGERWTSSSGILREATVVNETLGETEGSRLTFEFVFESNVSPLGVDVTIRQGMTPVLFLSSAYFSDLAIPHGRNTIKCKLDPINLAIGTYTVDVRVCEPMRQWLEAHESILTFVCDRQFGARKHFQLVAERGLGNIIPSQQWHLEQHREIR